MNREQAMKGKTFNIYALRYLPYVMLAKAFVSIVMLAIVVLAVFRSMAFGDDYIGNIVYETADFMMLIVFLSAIACLRRLESLSERFQLALRLFVALVIVFCMIMITTSIEGHLLVNHQQADADRIDHVTYALVIIKMMLFCGAVYNITLGLGEALEKTGEHIISGRIGEVGKWYLITSIITLTFSTYSEFFDINMAWLSVTISILISAAFETVLFIMERKASVTVWEYYAAGGRQL